MSKAEAVTTRTVLIAIDGSTQSAYAFEYYLANFHKSNVKLILIHAVETGTSHHDFSSCFHGSDMEVGTSGSLWDRLPEKQTDKIKALEDEYRTQIKYLKLDGHFEVVLAGKTGEAICKRALDEHCSLIVIGSRGFGLVKSAVLGSISEFVAHHAHCPVLICRQEGAGITNACGPI